MGARWRGGARGSARGSTLERLLKIADLLEIDGAAAELVARICGVAKTCPPAE